eukprot:g41278.t1
MAKERGVSVPGSPGPGAGRVSVRGAGGKSSGSSGGRREGDALCPGGVPGGVPGGGPPAGAPNLGAWLEASVSPGALWHWPCDDEARCCSVRCPGPPGAQPV